MTIKSEPGAPAHYQISATVQEQKLTGYDINTHSWWARLWGKMPTIEPKFEQRSITKTVTMQLTDVQVDFMVANPNVVTMLLTHGVKPTGCSFARVPDA